MKPLFTKSGVPMLAATAWLAGLWPVQAQTNGLLREVYGGIGGTSIADLTNNPAYPGSPTSTNFVTDFFEAPVNTADNYGQRMLGFVIPPQTGNYVFWIASDDDGELFLSMNESPAYKQLIAYVSGWTDSRQWNKYASQQSAPIPLVAGQPCYIEAISKEGGGGDNLAVGWQLPNTTVQAPIPGNRLVRWGVIVSPPKIFQQPASTNVIEGQSATFTVGVANAGPVYHQWRRGVTNIPGANSSSYTIASTAMTDNGAQFSCFLTNSLGTSNSATATLFVTPDTNAPTLVSAVNVGSNNVQVSFSEPVAVASATSATNYTLNSGATVFAAAFGADTKTIVLTTSPLIFGSNYTLRVSHVKDRAATPNTIAANSTAIFFASEFTPQDVGDPALAGAQTRLAANAFNVAGAGNDIGGTSDQFQFSHQLRTGNFDFRARIESLDLSDVWAKAGLVAREDLTAGSRFAGAMATPGLSGCFFESRNPAGSAASLTGSFPVNYPATWLRLQRVGNQFYGYASYDGQTWTQMGSANIAMSATVYFGLAVSSHNPAQPATAFFRDIADVSGAVVGTPTVNSEPLGPSSRKTGLVISEMMYKPAARTDGKDLEFIELFNSNPFYEDISGYQLTGEADFIFPPGTIIPGGGFLVVAKVPADVQSAYGIENVIGPFTNSLGASGTIRLRNNVGAIYLEIPYEDNPPWPVAADGAGHSLVLARPSYGEADPRAWDISDMVGGSPGGYEAYRPSPLRAVVINEFLAHTDPPLLDYIELYNHANQAVNVGGCIITDDPGTNRFVIPSPTIIPARGFASFTETALGFRLDAVGETIYFKNTNGTRVLDCVRFEGQENSRSMGRSPDGASEFYPLQSRTPGTNNSAILIRDIVVNEIMYNPISGNDDDEYVELYNKSDDAINVGGWRFMDGITYTLPANTMIPANGYLVVARNKASLLTRYAGLNTNNTVGDFDGQLSNAGERLALAMPEEVINTNTPGVTTTNTAWIVVDEVTYRDGGRWGQWADGGGSSLELIDPRGNHRLAYNWADSDETAKAAWTNIEATGVLDNGSSYTNGPISRLQAGMLGPGECLLDDIEVRPGGAGANIVSNAGFESGTSSWSFQGDHVRSTVDTASAYAGTRCLRIRASDQMWTGANAVEGNLTATTLTPGQTVTLRFKARWLRGWPEVLLRLNGNWLEAPGKMALAANPGTPGAVNSRYVANAGPAIYEVGHSPSIPAANQAVVVTARVHDPDAPLAVQLKYRVDPAVGYTTATMTDTGGGGDAIASDGIHSATIPAQAGGTVVAFYVQATDGLAAVTRFPTVLANGAPVRECVVFFGDTVTASSFGSYHLWLTQTNINRWSNLPDLSNEPHDGTWVYGSRIIYNMQSAFTGSPYHQQFDSPIGNACHYSCDMPEDDEFLGTTSFNKIHVPGNGPFDDSTIQLEQTAYWMVRQLNLPWLYRRYVAMYVNGSRRGTLMEDTQVPNGEVIQQHFEDDEDGHLFKLQPWFEFAPDGSGFENQAWCSLLNYTTTGGAKKLARYRWNYQARKVELNASDYTNVFSLIDAANSYGTPNFVQNLEGLADMEQWMRTFAMEHAVGNWDSFTYQNSQNMYAYKPQSGRWNLFIWDYAFVLGKGHGPGANNLFQTSDSTAAQIYANPTFRRAYLRAFKEIADGPMLNANVDPIMDAKYAAFIADGLSVASPSGTKGWIATMRNSLLSTLASESADAPFAVTSNSGNNFSTNKNFIAISGTAPVEVKTITINGIAYPALWNSVTGWTITLALAGGANAINIQGLDYYGNPVGGAADTITITYTGPVEPPQGRLVINEIMYNSAVPGADFIEVRSTATNNAFDLSGWRLNGADFSFPGGTILPPGGYLVVAEDASAFITAYGVTIPIAGVFAGNLDNGGETLQLIKPGPTPEQDAIIDQVTYDDDAPWPVLADGFGPSLQLLDSAQDNNRVANWAATLGGGGGGGPQSVIGITGVWKYNQSGADLGTAWRGTNYSEAEWSSGGGLLYVESSSLPAAKTTALTIGRRTYYFRKSFNLTNNPALTALEMNTVIDDGAVFYLNGVEVLRRRMPSGTISYTTYASSGVGNAVYEGPFDISAASLVAGTNVLAVEVHQANGGNNGSDIVFGLTLNATPMPPGPQTPGAINSVSQSLAPLPLAWLNEVQPNNVTGPRDNFNEREPWVELHNSGTNAIDLSGYYLSDNYTNLTRWPFPGATALNAGQYRLVWLDNEPGETSGTNLHASFRASPTNGSVVLTKVSGSVTTVVDYLNYQPVNNDRSYGAYPNGTPAKRQTFYFATPGASNNAAFPATSVVINEIMAGNTKTLSDTADGDFDDWFELYNFGPAEVDLSGFTLTDEPGEIDKWTIPNGTVIPSGGYLLVWADEETDQSGESGADLHADFKLGLGGESVGLYAPNGSLIDSITFGQQTNDVTRGRWPDANSSLYFMTTPTPRAANVLGNATNAAPVLAAIGNQSGDEGAFITFTASATDPNAGQVALYSLDPGAPTNAAINAESGVFTWTPTEAQGPGVYPVTIRVTDNGASPLDDFETINVTVNEVNTAPTLLPIGDQVGTVGQPVTLTVFASDFDLPLQALAFSLEDAPTNAAIDSSTGEFTWTPTVADGPGDCSVTVVVTDSGTAPLNAAETITISVAAAAEFRITGVSVTTNRAVTLTWNSIPGKDYGVEYVTNLEALSNWVPLGTINATNTSASAIDDTTAGAAQRYYRVRWINP